MNPRKSVPLFVALAILPLVLNCHRSEKKKPIALVAKAKADAALLEKIDQFVYDGPLFMKNKTLSEVRQLGVLMDEKVTYEDNPNVDNAKIEFRTFRFEGLEVSGVVDKGSFSAISIIVTDPRWPILHNLNVGTSSAQVPSALGQPPRSMKGPVEEFSGETETVKFTIHQGKINKIEFQYYFD